MSLDSFERNNSNLINEENNSNNELNNSYDNLINNKQIKSNFCNYYILPKKGIPLVELEGFNCKINNYWLITKNPQETINYFLSIYNPQDIFITDTYLSRSFYKHYIGQKIILLTKLPKTPFHFLIKLNSCIVSKGRIVPSCKYDVYYSNDVTLIILANKKFTTIKDDYLKFNKGKELFAKKIVNDLKKKFTVSFWLDN